MSKDSDYIDFSNGLNLLKSGFSKIKNFKYLEHSLFGLIALLALFLRTRNLPLLKGKYLVGLDPYYYFRQAREIIHQGFLNSPDLFRNPPFGVEKSFDLFPYVMAYWSKFLGLFGISQEMAHIIYPPLFMVLSLIPLYLFLKNVLSKQIAFLSILFLSIIPGYLFRTSAGFADHEALAMFFFFSALYLFGKGLDFKSNKKYIYGVGAGIATFLLAASWSGYAFIFLTFSLFLLLKLFFSKTDINYYLVWFTSFAVPFILLGKFKISNFGILFTLGVFGILIVNELLKKFNFNAPMPVISVAVAAIFGLIINSIFKLVDLNSIIFNILNAGGTSKVDFTTSEVNRAFVMSGNGYFASYGYLIFLAIFGLFLLTLNLFKNLEVKSKWIVSLFTAGSISVVLLGNWSSSVNIMKNSYVQFLSGVFILFLAYYSYLYYSKQYSKISNISNGKLLLILAMFVATGLLARTAVRFVFLFGPAVVILAAYAVDDIYEHSKKIQFGKLALILIIAMLSFNLAISTFDQNSRMGSGLPGQWEASMDWISTAPESSVIAHWWDYGYWTQAVGERASVQDGGKPGGGFMVYTLARYGMTHDDPHESLEYFKAHDTTHLLYSSEEIGKYGAFSYLGSDSNDDRQSVIGTFGLSEVNEVRDGDKLTYRGKWYLDESLVDGKIIIGSGQGYISEISIYLDETGVYAPATAKIIAQNYQNEFEIGCVYIHNTKFDFESSLNSCIKIVPILNSGTTNELGGLMYLSEKVKDSLFTRLYLHSETIEGFSLAYSDSTPLGFVNGRTVGPIKIWEIDYPNNLNNVERFLDEAKLPEFKENYIL